MSDCEENAYPLGFGMKKWETKVVELIDIEVKNAEFRNYVIQLSGYKVVKITMEDFCGDMHGDMDIEVIRYRKCPKTGLHLRHYCFEETEEEYKESQACLKKEIEDQGIEFDEEKHSWKVLCEKGCCWGPIAIDLNLQDWTC